MTMLRNEDIKHTNAVRGVQSLISSYGTIYRNPELSNNTISLESLDDNSYQTVKMSLESLKSELRRNSDLMETIGTHHDEYQIDIALEAAAYTIMAADNASSYFNKATINSISSSFEGQEGVVIIPMDQVIPSYSLESFDPVSYANYIAATAVANAQNTIAGGFEEVWFQPQLITAGESGVDLVITIPKVFQLTQRSNDGTPVDFKKISIIDTIIDPTILESEVTTIVPYAVDNVTPIFLVPAAQIPTTVKSVNGIEVETRPILFGKSVDLLSLSNAPGLLTVGVLDETDSLDSIMNIGTVFCKLVIDNGTNEYTTYIQTDVSSQPGALLTQVQQGRVQKYQTTCEASIVINQNITVVNGDTAANVINNFRSILSLGANDPFNVVFTVNLSATGDTETAHFIVNANNTQLVKYYNASGVSGSLAPFSANGVSCTLTPIGYSPQARRTNSNLRQNGTIIDANTTFTLRYAVPLSAPIISQTPLNSYNVVVLETLSRVGRIRANGRCVKALENLENMLTSEYGIPAYSPIAGAMFVTPTYVQKDLDVTTVVTNLNSRDSLFNLRGSLVAAMTNMANELLVKSGYLAALEFMDEDIDNYQIIVVTDVEIYPHIMLEADVRTFGDSRDYKITKSNNKFFRNKIYMSLRRKTRNNKIYPLDFARLLICPSMTYEVPISRNGRTTKEVHTIPRVAPYITLPILGRVNVENLDSLYASPVAI